MTPPLMQKSFRISFAVAVLAGSLSAGEPSISLTPRIFPRMAFASTAAAAADTNYPIPESPSAVTPTPGLTAPVAAPVPRAGCACNPNGVPWAMYGTPGGYEGRIGSPYHYYNPYGGMYMLTGNPYYDHFGPGYHRHSLYGHYRFPYYNYRAPWYYPGRAVYNRDINFAW